MNDFYRSFQIKKILEKIKQFQVDFNYNLVTKQISFDNVKIDKNSDENIDNFINILIHKKKEF